MVHFYATVKTMLREYPMPAVRLDVKIIWMYQKNSHSSNPLQCFVMSAGKQKGTWPVTK